MLVNPSLFDFLLCSSFFNIIAFTMNVNEPMMQIEIQLAGFRTSGIFFDRCYCKVRKNDLIMYGIHTQLHLWSPRMSHLLEMIIGSWDLLQCYYNSTTIILAKIKILINPLHRGDILGDQSWSWVWIPY